MNFNIFDTLNPFRYFFCKYPCLFSEFNVMKAIKKIFSYSNMHAVESQTHYLECLD